MEEISFRLSIDFLRQFRRRELPSAHFLAQCRGRQIRHNNRTFVWQITSEIQFRASKLIFENQQTNRVHSVDRRHQPIIELFFLIKFILCKRISRAIDCTGMFRWANLFHTNRERERAVQTCAQHSQRANLRYIYIESFSVRCLMWEMRATLRKFLRIHRVENHTTKVCGVGWNII